MTSAAPDRHVSGAAADREAGRPRRGEGGRRAGPAEDGDTSTAVPRLPFSGEDGVAQRGQAPAQGDPAKGQSQGGPAAPACGSALCRVRREEGQGQVRTWLWREGAEAPPPASEGPGSQGPVTALVWGIGEKTPAA